MVSDMSNDISWVVCGVVWVRRWGLRRDLVEGGRGTKHFPTKMPPGSDQSWSWSRRNTRLRDKRKHLLWDICHIKLSQGLWNLFSDFIIVCLGTSLFGVESFGGHNYYFSWLDEDAKVIANYILSSKQKPGNFEELMQRRFENCSTTRFGTTSGTGSTQGTTAGNVAWTSFHLRRARSMSGLKASSTETWISNRKEVLLHTILIVFEKVPFFWTSGRKCNFDGCDKPEFFPKLINGWFWSANQVIVG